MKLYAVFQSKCSVALCIELVPTACPFPCENNTQIIQATAKSLACDSEGELPAHSRYQPQLREKLLKKNKRKSPLYSQLLSLISKGRNGLLFSPSKLHCFFHKVFCQCKKFQRRINKCSISLEINDPKSEPLDNACEGRLLIGYGNQMRFELDGEKIKVIKKHRNSNTLPQ